MKQCNNCSAEVPNEFTICWNCDYHFDSKSIATFVDVEREEVPNEMQKLELKEINCLRCDTPMEHKGRHRFNKRTTVSGMHNFWDLLMGGMMLDAYICPNCKKVEFFGGEYFS